MGPQGVLDGGSVVEDAAELGSLSMVPIGCTIPSGQKWAGSPAIFQSDIPPLAGIKLSGLARKLLLTLVYALCTFLVLPLFLPHTSNPRIDAIRIRLHGHASQQSQFHTNCIYGSYHWDRLCIPTLRC